MENRMNLFASQLPMLLTGITVLIAGKLISAERKQSRKAAFIECLGCVLGFLITFSVVILAFASV